MACILRCILWVSLFQLSIHATEIPEGRSVREGERAANQKSNGSYKILNRLVKPFVSKRVEDRFVFPGEYQKPEVFEKPVIPDECKEIGICEDIPNYPEELVDNLIHELMRQNRTRFNKDMLEVPQIAQRIGPEDDNIELCDTVEKLYAPRAAQDSNMEWHVIVNDKKKPQQTFRVEICKAKESACSSIAYFQNGYKARCVQKFMLRNMLAINDQQTVVEKAFQVPSCCSCIARQT
ncbi:uncharacterized protein [Maniola hyperantus]|uniref:uncharacterized protein isoform X1 n=1 Tax=Aphantopus hyperantus TaxID=2795564 RepID=UPI0015680EB8|nr:protein spaetzle isoform X1 [Maniola hyperantus]XP_034829745.1 protein spaetzle isoform X1 [Maniola hyperantus]